MVLVQEDGGASHLQSELLDALLVVNGQQEGLAALLGLDCRQDGEVLRERITWSGREGGGGSTGESRSYTWQLKEARNGNIVKTH